MAIKQSYEQDGSNWGIYGQRFDSSGNTVGVSSGKHLYNGGQNATVTALDNGAFLVAWDSDNQKESIMKCMVSSMTHQVVKLALNLSLIHLIVQTGIPFHCKD